MKTKRIYVYCKDTNQKGIIAYYVESSEGVYLLFTQKFRHSSYQYFHAGLPLEKAIKHPSHNDAAISNTVRRILPSIHYIEKTYDVQLLNKSKKVA
ncbi:MAG TPA: hypothetical protein DCO72_09365 [Ruminococcus sp.]|nr:hypothetical protein [Ruminococcus sp.]